MASVGAIGDSEKFLRIIHVSDEFSWPMTWDAWYSYASKYFTIDTVFEIFIRVESSFFLRSWIDFHCNEKFLMQGYHYMFPAVSELFVHLQYQISTTVTLRRISNFAAIRNGSWGMRSPPPTRSTWGGRLRFYITWRQILSSLKSTMYPTVMIPYS